MDIVVFNPGQFVVYPAQGVGVIERMERQELAGFSADFYIVRIIGSNITVMVPVKSANNTGLRSLSSKNKAAEVLKSLQDREGVNTFAGQNWNRRQREYTERLKSGALEDVAGVLKELILISAGKELSFGEKRLMEQAMDLLSAEMGQVLDKPHEQIKTEIESYFEDILHPVEEELPEDPINKIRH